MNSTTNSTAVEENIYLYTPEGRASLTLIWFAVTVGPPILFCTIICFLIIARHRYKYVREHSPILLFLKSAAAIAIYSYLFVIWFCPLLGISNDWPFLWLTILPLLYITPHVTRLYNITLVHLTIILKSKIIRGSKDLSPLLNVQGQPASPYTPGTPTDDSQQFVIGVDAEQFDKDVVDNIDGRAELLTKIALFTSSKWFYGIAFALVVFLVCIVDLPMLIMLFIPSDLYSLVKYDIISYYGYAILFIVGVLSLLLGVVLFIIMLAIRVKEAFYIRLTTFLSLGCLALTLSILALYILFNAIWSAVSLPNRASYSIYCILLTFISWTIFLDVLITCGIPLYLSIRHSIKEMQQIIQMQKQDEEAEKSTKSYIQEYEELEKLFAFDSRINFVTLSSRQKLLAILKEKDHLKKFRLFAKTEWSVENVIFFEFWDQFRKQVVKEIHSSNPNYEYLFAKFFKMYDLFLGPSATLSLNIPSDVTQQAAEIYSFAANSSSTGHTTIPFVVMQYKEELPQDAFEDSTPQTKGRVFSYLKIHVLQIVMDKVMKEVIANLLDTFSRFQHTSDMQRIVEMYRVNHETGTTLWRSQSDVHSIAPNSSRVVNHTSHNEIKVAL